MIKTPIRDWSLERERIKRYKELTNEYQQIKDKKHPDFKFVKYWAKARGICIKTFHKYYNRYKQGKYESFLLPAKRGPKYKTGKPYSFIENEVLELRMIGTDRYEISSILKEQFGKFAPSASGVYNIFKRHELNTLKPPVKELKKKIIKMRCGEMGHIDAHHLSKYVIRGKVSKLYLVGVMDDYSRIVWVELMEDNKALTTMFGAIKCFNALKQYYHIVFEEILSDNGSEFGNRLTKQKEKHPFERLLIEMGIKHRYTKPYRPQTNGKIERFWRTIEEQLIEGTDFDSKEELQKELVQYLYYFNHLKPNQALGGKKPVEMVEVNNNTLTPAAGLEILNR
jgi:transposase InsO family protein